MSKNNIVFNKNNYINIKDVFYKFPEDSDAILKHINSTNIPTVFIEDVPHISKDDFKLLKNTIYQSRIHKEVTLDHSTQAEEDELITFNPCNNNETFFLKIITELVDENKNLKKELETLQETHNILGCEHIKLLDDLHQCIKDKDFIIKEYSQLAAQTK